VRSPTLIEHEASQPIRQPRRSRGRTITEADIVSFSALTGDWHPQHADASWAAESMFGERLAHGLLVLSVAMGLAELDHERAVALCGVDDVRFKSPVRIGDTIYVITEISDVRSNDERLDLLRFRWQVVNQHEKLVMRASISILWRKESTAGARA
jgi:acyl dehydratase